MQRRFLLRIIKGYTTINYEAVFAISGISPIDLVILNNLDIRGNYYQPWHAGWDDSSFIIATSFIVNSTEKLVVEVQSILYYLDCNIHFSYVRGHSGNLGNDRVNQLAKEATCQDMNILMNAPLSHWKHVAWERTVSSWNTGFLASLKALWTKRFLPTIYQRLKSCWSKSAQELGHFTYYFLQESSSRGSRVLVDENSWSSMSSHGIESSH
ncbi:hypothetical protein TNCV_2949681 [Trichonephila clavipes]|nr:hypothetical protein TNCV_2949681 [Trichonephila clavipes]